MENGRLLFNKAKCCTTHPRNKLERFTPAILFSPTSTIFGQAMSIDRECVASLANIRLGWKLSLGYNALAYHSQQKSFPNYLIKLNVRITANYVQTSDAN